MEERLEELNRFLANLNVFYRKLQNYHWNIEGEDFFEVHAKLEEYYDEVNEQIDEIAEHILTLDGQPWGTLRDYIEKATLEEAENKKITSSKIFKQLIEDLESLRAQVLSIKKKAEVANDYGTSSLMDEYILDYEKKLWMLHHVTK